MEDFFQATPLISQEEFDVIQVSYNKADTLNPILEEKIRSMGDEMGHRSNVKADMTDFRLYEDPDFKKICDFAILQSINSIEGLSQRGAQIMRWSIIDCWGMVYKNQEGHHTVEHAHWPATFSFVYYVNACEKCSPLQFTRSNFKVKPRSGLMVLFPGNTSHNVPHQNCDHDRVAISGNISATINKKEQEHAS